MEHTSTSRVVEDTNFASKYFDYRSSSENYLSTGVTFDSADFEFSGLDNSRQKLIAITKSGFGAHLGIKDSSNRDTGIVRTNSSNQLQVNSTGLYTPTWVNVTTGLSTDPIQVANGDTILIEVLTDHSNADNILIEIDILRVNGTVLELSANSIPHNDYNWNILVLRHGTFKGADILSYVGHDARRELLQAHATDKWFFDKAKLVTSVTDGLELAGNTNVNGALSEQGTRVSTTGDGGGGGTPGPAGPQGPKGDPGPAGPIGPQGEKGDKGDKGDTGDTGPAGTNGQDGQDGQDGAAGEGVAPGGDAGQILAKATGADYDTEWIDAPSGGGGTPCWLYSMVTGLTDTLSSGSDRSTLTVTKWQNFR